MHIYLREALKKPIESVSMLIPPSDPPPPTVSALGYFFCDVFWIIGVVWYAVPFLVNFDQNYAKQRKRRTVKL